MPRFLLLAFLAPLTLAGCGRHAGGGKDAADGTSITLDADNGQVASAVDGRSGALKIDLPGFKGEVSLPRIKLNADDFDLNGVHLYPGSTIETVNVGGGAGGKGGDGLRIAFTSPAAPPAVHQWFAGKLKSAGFTLSDQGEALVGKTEEGKPFRMDLTPKGAGGAAGVIVIGS